LKVAFANLFENGCKFSRDKSCVAVVSFSRFKARYPDSPLITLDFRDKGAGISEADLKNIFIPFYRGENKNIAQGNGIGLSLTQKIIGLHSGNISVESERNSGTIFRVELPAIGD
jgi:signal transduction histidine kinase